MGKLTFRGSVTSETVESTRYGLLCANNLSTPLAVASPLPLEVLQVIDLKAKPEDLFPENSEQVLDQNE